MNPLTSPNADTTFLSSLHPLHLAFMATIAFAFSSQIFTEYSRKISPLWMNCFKAVIALFCFSVTLAITNTWVNPSLSSAMALLASGLLGLMIGDLFMLEAMKELGASRMLMIFGLEPFLLGVAAYFLFGQSLSIAKFIAVGCMLLCLFTFSLENYKKSGHWQLRGLLFGLIAISLDSIGILLTRYGFDNTSGINSIEVNFLRCVGAVAGFGICHLFFKRIELITEFHKWPRLDKTKIIIGSIGGTYLSLMLYLTAVGKGTLSTVSSVTVTGPLFAALFETIRYRKLPSPYLVVGLIFFVIGFLLGV